MQIKTFLLSLFLLVISVLPFVSGGQNLFQGNEEDKIRTDTDTVQQRSYKTTQIAFEIENVNRYIKEQNKQIEASRNIAVIDSSFSRLSKQIEEEFTDFTTFNKLNLSKYFLLNTKRVWLSYKSQLTNWQNNVSKRIAGLMDISDRIKEKEKLWEATASKEGSERLPKEIYARIRNSLNELNKLETNLFNAVSQLSLFDSRIADQLVAIDQHIEIIDALHANYRANIFKATQPVLWKIKLKNSYEDSAWTRMEMAWHENLKSLKNSLPSVRDQLDNFIIWCLLIITFIVSVRYFFLRQLPSKRLTKENNINEMIVRHPVKSVIFLVLFTFAILITNIPLVLSGMMTLVELIIAYFLLRMYSSQLSRRLIITFFILMTANILEILLWYFGNYARLYLLFEAGLGILLIWPFIKLKSGSEILPEFRFGKVVILLRYPIFFLYVTAFLVNLFGFKDLTVLLLKIATQVSVSIFIIIGAWEISKSIIHLALEVLAKVKGLQPLEYLPLLHKRTTLFLSLFFALVWFHAFLAIVELDTPFYEGFNKIMKLERHIGSFVFTYNAIFQFILIMLITWGLNSIIRIVFNEGNFKRTQRMRGVPAAISTTLRMIVAFAGFFLALSGAGIDITKISILIGAFGVGIGFGLQDIVNNFISGLVLIYERPIQVGDTIEINALMGVVKSIGIRSSRVRTFDGAEVVVPNSVLVSAQLINWTLSDEKRRIEIMVGVKYGTDPAMVVEILKQVADQNPLVQKDPEPLVLFNEFADSSLNFRLLCWVLFENSLRAKSDLSVAINKAFNENNIEIPFPQLDLHVKKDS